MPDDRAWSLAQISKPWHARGHGTRRSAPDETAHHYGLLCGRLRQLERRPRGRAMDLMIAATALSLGVALVTRNTADVEGLGVALLTR
jgi:toxin FitB